MSNTVHYRMITAFRNLLGRAWLRLLRSLGTTTLSIVVFSIAIPFFVWFLSLIYNVRHEAKRSLIDAIQSSVVSWPTLISVGLTALVWLVLFSWSSVKTLYEEHSELVAAICRLEKENTALRQSLVPASPTVPQSNLLVMDVLLGTLYLAGDIWSRTVPEGLTGRVPRFEAIFAEIKNAGKQGEAVGPVYKIRAELLVGKEEYTPLPWIDQYYSTVNFEFGDVKYLVLAVGMSTPFPALGDWRVVLSHRTDGDLAPGVSSMNFDRCLKRVAPELAVRLNFLHVARGQILANFEGTCRWKEGYGRPSISFKQLG